MDDKIKIIIAIIAFVLVFFALYINNLSKISKIKKGKKKKNNKEVILVETQYLFFKYKIIRERLYTKKYALIFALINSTIIVTTFLVIELIPWHFAFKMLIGFVLLLGLIYSIYGIIGSILVKRGYQNEHK